jgi:uncharacterized protein (UPF0212 family)
MTSLNAAEVDAPKLAVPAYTTVIGLLPTGKVLVLNAAVLLRPIPGFRVAVPIAVAPFMKVTDPVGAVLVLVTVALNVTDCPKLTGLTGELTVATVAEVPVELTTWLIADDVAAPKLPDPA